MGNHELESMYSIFGTKQEIIDKCSIHNLNSVVTIINNFVSNMSISGIINNKIFICHGMPCEYTPLIQIKQLNTIRNEEQVK